MRKLHVSYSGELGRYNCYGACADHGTARCISISGLSIDAAVSTEVLRVLKPRSANLIGLTPIGAPRVSTIKTSELRALIGDGEGSTSGELPLLLSTNCSNCLRVTIPGTNFVPDAYRNGMLDDAKRRALKVLVDQLLHGDWTRRVITFSWNANSWDARNLALELVALGYPKSHGTAAGWRRGTSRTSR